MTSGGNVSVEPAKPAPKEDDPAVQSAISEAARRRQKSRGYRSTILSQASNRSQPNQRLQTLGS